MFSKQNNNPVLAQTNSQTTVDVELVLSVDVSGSISGNEFRLQRDGYVAAFNHPDVIEAIRRLPNGLAVTLQYWSTNSHNAIGWYHIKNETDAQNFANAIANASRPSSGYTNVTDAITSATQLLQDNNYNGTSLVIDVSGDGLDNRNGCDKGSYKVVASGIKGLARTPIEDIPCSALQGARDAAVAAGITINGLAILSPNKVVKSGKKVTVGNEDLDFIVGRNYFAFNREDEIHEYYEENVIGGENAFVEIANGFNDFERAAINKIKTEITNNIIFAD
ncbi:MAG: DUF1194 domain-containing protein [Xenococcaceae cyanobacterium MO_234.B1]|nr:DUF1194 domain-containing protein [Xenococcaceae cyanobacterium MO_234.B1]